MKKLLFAAIIAVPRVTLAQFDDVGGWDAPESTFDQGPYPIIVQPGISVPAGRGPWGTGYSVVTETRERPDAFRQWMGDRDASSTVTTQRVVPNDALGQPMIGMAPFWAP